jgi:hypothetical protein
MRPALLLSSAWVSAASWCVTTKKATEPRHGGVMPFLPMITELASNCGYTTNIMWFLSSGLQHDSSAGQAGWKEDGKAARCCW